MDIRDLTARQDLTRRYYINESFPEEPGGLDAWETSGHSRVRATLRAATFRPNRRGLFYSGASFFRCACLKLWHFKLDFSVCRYTRMWISHWPIKWYGIFNLPLNWGDILETFECAMYVYNEVEWNKFYLSLIICLFRKKNAVLYVFFTQYCKICFFERVNFKDSINAINFWWFLFWCTLSLLEYSGELKYKTRSFSWIFHSPLRYSRLYIFYGRRWHNALLRDDYAVSFLPENPEISEFAFE